MNTCSHICVRFWASLFWDVPMDDCLWGCQGDESDYRPLLDDGDHRAYGPGGYDSCETQDEKIVPFWLDQMIVPASLV